MSKLLDNNNQLITDRIPRAIPRPDAIKVENRTLDGQYHLQTIGTPAMMVDLEVIVGEAGKQALDYAESTGAPVRFEADGKYRLGVIRGAPDWDLLREGSIAKRLWRASMQLIVTDEGVL